MFSIKVPGSTVSVDRVSGRPREIRFGGEQLPVMALVSVREERAAYPYGVGPRTVFVVITREGRYRLTQRHLDGTWVVEEMGRADAGYARAA